MERIKGLLLVMMVVLPGRMVAQDSVALATTLHYMVANKIKLNTLEPPPGYRIYYNCDSMLFVRGDFGDTIKIWTPGMQWAHTLEEFKKLVKSPEYGKNIFAKVLYSDGRIQVDTYHETAFLFRSDSLYEIVDTLSGPAEYVTMIVDRTMGKIDEATFQRKKDSLDQIYSVRHVYVPKLIFSKTMFRNKKKVTLSPKVNVQQDEIVLENQWIENGKKCYLVRINNRFGNEKTTYAYAINEDMKFVWWEGCNK